MRSYLSLFSLLALFLTVHSKTINFETDCGGIPDTNTLDTAWKNGGLINTTFAQLQPGDVFLFPNKTFYIMGGIIAQNLQSVTIQFEGTLIFNNDTDSWPRNKDGSPLGCILFQNVTNVTWTSSGTAMIDGNGAKWWGPPVWGYLIDGHSRPKLFNIADSSQLLVENIIFKDSPCWTFWANRIDGLEVRNCQVSARRTDSDKHTLVDLTAWNTDGFDVTGKNVWIHDCQVWNQDDCFCVKDGSENMLFERINASGLGLTVGSISGSTVRNITFRDVYMLNTYKGIYLKFRAGDQPGLITDILYENIYMESPEQWPIWIGPAQQAVSDNLCAANPCSLCWPMDPLAKCDLPAAGHYQNITIRNVTISNPPKRVGVIMANETNPMTDILFDGVRVINYDKIANDYDYFKCESVTGGVAIGDTWPVPSCFQNNTISAEMMDLIQ